MMNYETTLLKLNAYSFLEKYQNNNELICKALIDTYMSSPNKLRNFLLQIASDLCPNSNDGKHEVITLYSQSPRRKALLEKLFPKKEICILENGNIPELYLHEYTPELNTLSIALQKMFSFLINSPEKKDGEQIVITADTIVELPGSIPIGKLGGKHDPLSNISPIEKLKYIVNAGKDMPIKVHTACTLFNAIEQKLVFEIDTTLVQFNALEKTLNKSEVLLIEEINAIPSYKLETNNLPVSKLSYQDILIQYVQKGLHKGKAGGFDIRDRDFFLCIKKINGDPTTIIGLPCAKLGKVLSGSIDLNTIIKNIWPNELEQNKIDIQGG